MYTLQYNTSCHTSVRRALFDDMRQVKVDALDMRVSRSDLAKSHSKATANINKFLKVLKTLVEIKNLLDNNGGVVEHCCVEHLVKPGVQTWILKGMCAIHPVKWDSSFQNSTFQLEPVFQCVPN